jgi:putative hydrolase of HD superfamily
VGEFHGIRPISAARRTKVIAITVAIRSDLPEEAQAIFEFLLDVCKMKSIPRSGWISHGISLSDVESVADHSFSTSALSILLADLETRRGMKVDVERVLRMALLHDMAESLTFDISKGYLSYLGKRGDDIKSELESSAWRHLADGLKDDELARNYTRLQSEFDASETLESRIVHAADGLDILLQVIEYRGRGYPESLLKELWNGTNAKLRQSKLPSVRRIRREIVAQGMRLGAGRIR